MLVLPINFFAFIYIFFNVLKYYTYKKVFMQYLFTKKYNIFLVGSNGIEPSTSRLSGVRSNHLSYEPIF